MSYNKVILMGNLTRDPEYKVTPNGHQICKLGIAVNRRFTTQSGEQREEVTFVDVDAWGRQAETISKFFTKGKPILVEGRLRMDEWENPQGERRSKLLVQLETFSFVSDGGGTQSSMTELLLHPIKKLRRLSCLLHLLVRMTTLMMFPFDLSIIQYHPTITLIHIS